MVFFATARCAGEDPQHLHFNTEGTSMREQCLENGVIQSFPSEMLKRRGARRDMKNDKIDTTCLRTEDEDMCRSVNVEKCSIVCASRSPIGLEWKTVA